MLTAKKNNYRRTLDSVIRFSCSIGENTTIKGQFTGGENIMVRGTVRGDSDVSGTIVIMDTGCWEGHLAADIVVIAGKVEGDVVAREKIEIVDGGHVLGDISSPIVAMESGSIHEGSIHMREKSQVCEFEEKRMDAMQVAT